MLLSHLFTAGLILAATPIAAEPLRLEAETSRGQDIDSDTIADEIAIGADADERMTIPVSVGGKGPYRFLVDTGSERTVISRELANRLKLSSGRNAVLHSVIGSNDVNTVHIPQLNFSTKTVSVVDAPTLASMDIGADGMLGVDSLRSQRVMFDFKANTMSITPSAQPLERMEGDTIVVRARARNGRLIFTEAKVNGRRVTVIVDTGSEVTIANLALRRTLATKELPGSVVIESVMGEKLDAKVARLPKLELGGIELEDLAVAFADAHIFKQLDLDKKPALLLGMNAMKAFDRVSIDFAAKRVRFVLPGTSMRQPIRMAAAGGI